MSKNIVTVPGEVDTDLQYVATTNNINSKDHDAMESSNTHTTIPTDLLAEILTVSTDPPIVENVQQMNLSSPTILPHNSPNMCCFTPLKGCSLLTPPISPNIICVEKSRTTETLASSLFLAIRRKNDKDECDGDLLYNIPEVDCSNKNKLKANTSRMSTAQCRICFSASGDELLNGNDPILVHPCACDGSIRFCHPECLLQWVRQSGSFVCELCKTRYSIKRSGLKWFTQWHLPTTDSIDWIHMVIFFFSVCFIVGSIVWMTWLGLGQRLSGPVERDPLSRRTHSNFRGTPSLDTEASSGGTLGDFMIPAFILYSIIDVLFLFIAGMELTFTIVPLIRKWYRMNQKLVIENHDNKAPNSPPRHVNCNIITPSNPATDVPNTLSLRASIPCVNEERDRIVQAQNSML